MIANETSKLAYGIEDNWSNFTYEDRFWDALANFFNIQGPCTAVIEESKTIFISYNSDLSKQHIDIFKLLTTILTNIINGNKLEEQELVQDTLLILYLACNTDFRDFTKTYARTHKNIMQLESFIVLRDKTTTYFKQHASNYDFNNFIDVVNSYKEILNTLQDKEHFDKFVRPMQDSYKLFNFLHNNESKRDIKFELVDNKHNLHAEANLQLLFRFNDLLEQNYIGISKLSCGYCHNLLLKSDHKHRGTHGICDHKWTLGATSMQEEKFKESVHPIRAFSQDSPIPLQHRSLSCDFLIEMDIAVNLAGEYTSLYQFKENNGLNVWEICD